MIVAVALALAPATQAQTKTAPVKKPTESVPAAKEDPQVYRNPTFGFSYQIPYGWVNRTKEMQEGNGAGKAELLLGVFEHPPEATGETINSAAVFASESAGSYPGLKRAEDYVRPLTEIATSQGFKTEGQAYALEVEGRQLLRADFTKTLIGKTADDKLTMRQCTLILLAQGQLVSFTFIADNEDGLDVLMDGLHFSAAKSSTH